MFTVFQIYCVCVLHIVVLGMSCHWCPVCRCGGRCYPAHANFQFHDLCCLMPWVHVALLPQIRVLCKLSSGYPHLTVSERVFSAFSR